MARDLGPATKYILRIRNPEKREYAVSYWLWLHGDRKHGESEPVYRCGYMAAQAVRMQLNEIWNWEPAQ